MGQSAEVREAQVKEADDRERGKQDPSLSLYPPEGGRFLTLFLTPIPPLARWMNAKPSSR